MSKKIEQEAKKVLCAFTAAMILVVICMVIYKFFIK